MKPSPFAGKSVMLQGGAPITDLRAPGSNQRMLSESNGEFNANSRKDLMVQISNLMAAVSSGQVVAQETSVSAAQRAADLRATIVAANLDPSKWSSLGADLVTEIEVQRNRDGLLRRLAMPQNLGQGEHARVICQLWDQTAIVATAPANVGFQVVRNKQFYPTEFEIIGNIRVEQLEIDQVGGQVLENAYNQGIDATMVKEDRLWKSAADKTVGVVNAPTYITGDLTPRLMMTMREGITDWNLPVSACLLANDFWKDLSSSEFTQFLDPVTKYDLALSGQLGTLLGMSILTDGFRQPNQKVLERGEIYIVSTPEHHACYSDRGGIKSTPTSGSDQGNTTKGWLLAETFSFTLANPRSVSKGIRI